MNHLLSLMYMKLLFLSSFFSMPLNIYQRIIHKISKIVVATINFSADWLETITELKSQKIVQLIRSGKAKQWRVEKGYKHQVKHIRNLDDLC